MKKYTKIFKMVLESSDQVINVINDNEGTRIVIKDGDHESRIYFKDEQELDSFASMLRDFTF